MCRLRHASFKSQKQGDKVTCKCGRIYIEENKKYRRAGLGGLILKKLYLFFFVCRSYWYRGSWKVSLLPVGPNDKTSRSFVVAKVT